jgi:ATP adenylyltransferase
MLTQTEPKHSDTDLKRAKPALYCSICVGLPAEQQFLSDDAGIAVASLGAFVDGWALVFPRRHVLALAEMTSAEWSSFDAMLATARGNLESVYGNVVLFEHGSAGSGRTAACGVNHAHMHIVALDVDLRQAIAQIAHEVGTFVWSASEGRPDSVPGQDYIFLSDNTGSWISHSTHLPGQVVRRALAATLGHRQWDWKENLQEERMLSVAETLRTS